MTDEKSGNEDNVDINNLPGTQLLSNAELSKHCSPEDDCYSNTNYNQHETLESVRKRCK